MVKRKHELDQDAASHSPKSRTTRERKTLPKPLALSTKKPISSSKASKAISRKTIVLINEAPTQRLDIYVFGANSQGELGLGPDATDEGVPWPQLNIQLASHAVGVVQIAVGRMHCVALTHDNKILTWGVNDNGALGRDTSWKGVPFDTDDMSDLEVPLSDHDLYDDTHPNPYESMPSFVDLSSVPDGTFFTEVAATDNASFALTTDGVVYGWGTFVTTDGSQAFTPRQKIQHRPVAVRGLRNVRKLSAGSNHILALTSEGHVFSWGFGEQFQLGRRILSRSRLNGLLPRSVGLSDIAYIGCGADHSFAINKRGDLYGWGSNNYGQTGICENVGEDNPPIERPTIVQTLGDVKDLIQITGGNHHTIAATLSGACLVWGRVETNALGLDASTLPAADTIQDVQGRPRILKRPTQIPDLDVSAVAAGSDHSIAVTKDGKAYSWGFNIEKQAGQGTDVDILLPTLLDNTAVRGKTIVWAGGGGQFSMLGGIANAQMNGTMKD